MGDHVFLKVKDNRSSLKMGSCTKLAARFCGPFEILERIGLVAYMIALSASMSIHNVFHVSLLNKYIPDANHVIDWNVIQVEQEGAFQVHPSARFGPESQAALELSHRAYKGSMDLVRS
jgi:hypothetical protein